MSHARVWGCIFDPGLMPDDVCNQMKDMSWNRYLQDLDLILIGSDIEYLYQAKEPPRPIHLLMLGIDGMRQTDFTCPADMTKLFRPHEAFDGGVKITDSEIVLHFGRITVPTLWKLGINQTCVLSYKASTKLARVNMTYLLDDDVPSNGESGLGYRYTIPFKFGTQPRKSIEVTAELPESMEELLREASYQFLGMQNAVETNQMH